ncbi:MAG TPA: menaquinol-cytochrome C reductase [Dehalococcoidia bacterium]|nr:menaquinol-cytochrome C reductase [Dehalococcoidia bacterium]
MAEQTATRPRPRREREEEVLVWPDLVFVEFIAAVLFTITLILLSTLVNAPLLDRANPDVTPNPSKAPWYLLNLQELLLHMEPGLAGVVIPTVALVGLAAIPYIDRKEEGRGVWFATPNAVKLTIFAWVYTVVLTVVLILFDAGKFESYTEWFPGLPDGQGLSGTRTLQTSWSWSIGDFDYPEDLEAVGAPFGIDNINFPGDRTLFLYWNDGKINLVQFMVEQVIPVTVILVLSIVLVAVLWALRWLRSVRDLMIVLFSGFMAVYVTLTVVGTAFRGEGQELVPPWDVPRHPEGA